MWEQAVSILNPYEALKKGRCYQVKHILCALGIHKRSQSVTLVEQVIRGKHRYWRHYAVCDRCMKKLHRVTWGKEKGK